MKAKITMTFEYELHTSLYPEGLTGKQMVAQDIKYLNIYHTDFTFPERVKKLYNRAKFSGELIDDTWH